MDYTIRAVDQAVTVLRNLARHASSTVTELAKETGYTKSLVFRILYTLEKNEVVVKSRLDRTYRLGRHLLPLSNEAVARDALLRAASPLLERLAEESGETASLVVRDGLQTIYLAVRSATPPGQIFARPGRHGPLHAGAGPKVLLAFAPPEVRTAVLSAPLRRYTPATITDPEKLAAVIDYVRRNEFSENYSDLDSHAFGYAAPIRNDSRVVAALSVAGALSRLTPDKAESLKRAVVSYARQISDVLRLEPGDRSAP